MPEAVPEAWACPWSILRRHRPSQRAREKLDPEGARAFIPLRIATTEDGLQPRIVLLRRQQLG